MEFNVCYKLQLCTDDRDSLRSALRMAASPLEINICAFFKKEHWKNIVLKKQLEAWRVEGQSDPLIGWQC